MNVKPKSRLENLLAKIAGRDDAKEIKTKTKGEELLNEIAENGGSGGGGGGAPAEPLEIIVRDVGYAYMQADKTLAEIWNAYYSGRPIIVWWHWYAGQPEESTNGNPETCTVIGFDAGYDNAHTIDELKARMEMNYGHVYIQRGNGIATLSAYYQEGYDESSKYPGADFS